MSKSFKHFILALMTIGAVSSASAFSLLMPYAAWQIPRIGYNPLNTDVGGVANLGEEYRWNTPTIYYGYDESFLNYFGTAGTNAVDQALAILNALPKFSQMSSDLSEFPNDVTRENHKATALGLIDLKSYTLTLMMEEVGLASPSRYTWTLRNRLTPGPVYTIIKRNFDPVTLAPSSFVNGALYTFVVQEFDPPVYADAVEVQMDPLQFGFSAVADGANGLSLGLFLGQYYTGLTRDDVGGLRYLYRTNNYQFENLLPGTTGSTAGGGCPWCPVGGTNVVATNAVPDLAIRPGLDKLTFKKGSYDSLIGSFITTTNVSTVYYAANGTIQSQTVQRVLTQPDILFTAEDLGITTGGTPVIARRTDTSGWANNDALNGQATLDGPGVIQPQVNIAFSKVGPYFFDVAPSFQGLLLPVGGRVWGSFDGRTNDPVIYPSGTSIYDMESQVLYGGGGVTPPSPYVLPNSLTGTNAAIGGP